jgi:hypothetical protein
MTGIQIHNYDTPGDKPEGQTWNRSQMLEDFDVVGFLAPNVVVRRKSDGVRGLLQFRHESPRIYWGFEPV